MINRLNGKRIYLRELKDTDASLRYQKWLSDKEVNKYLETHSATISQLKTYIKKRLESQSCLFLGIFEIKSDVHIGNIKLEPIDYVKRTAILGILIGDKKYWGKGFGSEAIRLLIKWSFSYLHLREIRLGVISKNIPAIKSYKKCGFKITARKKIKRKDGDIDDEIEMVIKNKKAFTIDASIIVRAHNCQSYIENCLKSTLNQNYSKNSYEIIVINDGSTDDTYEKLKNYLKEKNVFIFDQENRGPIESANLGFFISCGKYVTLLDCDDSFENNFLTDMVAVLESNKSADFVYCDYFERFNGNIAKIAPKNLFETVAVGVLFKRSTLLQGGLYKPGVGFAEYDLLLRNRATWSGNYVPNTLFTYNRMPNSLSSNEKSIKRWRGQLEKLHPGKIKQIRLIRNYDFQFTKKMASLLLRPAAIEDSKFFLSLRNLNNVRQWSFNNKRIDLESHMKWFLKKLNSDACALFILEKNGQKIGQIRFDIIDRNAQIDLAILPHFQAKGFGQFMIKAGCKNVIVKFPDIKKIQAIIMSANKQSIGSFLKAGFQNKGIVRYKGFECNKLELKS